MRQIACLVDGIAKGVNMSRSRQRDFALDTVHGWCPAVAFEFTLRSSDIYYIGESSDVLISVSSHAVCYSVRVHHGALEVACAA